MSELTTFKQIEAAVKSVIESFSKKPKQSDFTLAN